MAPFERLNLANHSDVFTLFVVLAVRKMVLAGNASHNFFLHF